MRFAGARPAGPLSGGEIGPDVTIGHASGRIAGTSGLTVFLVVGALTVPLSSFDLPIPGGNTKPLVALFWLPFAVLLCARAMLTLRINVVELVAATIALIGIAWFPVIVARGPDADIAQYVIRVAAFAAAFTVAIVASNIEDIVTLRGVVRLILTGYLVVLAYGFFVQIPGVLGFGPAYQFDVQLRAILLNRELELDRIQLMADEPSFAAYQAAVAVLMALTFRAMLPRRLVLAILALGVIDLIFMKSVSALAMLCFIVLALVLALRDPRLKIVIVAFGGVVLGTALSIVLSSTSAYDPLDRVAAISTDASANARFYLAKSTVDAGLDAGVLGLGPGQYSRVLLDFLDQSAEVRKNLPRNVRVKIERGSFEAKPFSMLGGVFAEFGAPALLALLAMYAYPVWMSWARRMPERGLFMVCAAASIVISMGAVPIALPDTWLLMGLLVAVVRMRHGIPTIALPRTASGPATAVPGG